MVMGGQDRLRHLLHPSREIRRSSSRGGNALFGFAQLSAVEHLQGHWSCNLAIVALAKTIFECPLCRTSCLSRTCLCCLQPGRRHNGIQRNQTAHASVHGDNATHEFFCHLQDDIGCGLNLFICRRRNVGHAVHEQPDDLATDLNDDAIVCRTPGSAGVNPRRAARSTIGTIRLQTG
jgi:hypothetical protein